MSGNGTPATNHDARRRWGPFAAVQGLRPEGEVPHVFPVRRQHADLPHETDPYAAARSALRPLGPQVRSGDRIAVTAGSRGISDIATVVRAAVDWLTEAGALPFVVPAMGSHGGATAQGQREVLAGIGITEESMGVPVRATMDTVVLGHLSDGTPVHHDREVAEADGVLLVNRVKPHTDFRGPVESGLAKILAIGLGNHRGAATMHAGGIAALGDCVVEAARTIVAEGRVLGGLAILENAHEETAAVDLVPADGIAGTEESALLDRARALLGMLPFDELDVLVVDEMGKDKSGTGMDTNVLGRCWVPNVPDFEKPDINVVSVHRLSPDSHGNAAGLGLADVMPLALLEQIDVHASYVNALASGAGGARRSRMPMVLEDDEAVVLAAVAMSGRRDHAQVRLARIRDTLSTSDLLVSAALLDEVEDHPELELLGDPVPLVEARNLSPWPAALTRTEERV
jgi:Lactate racemase N-terminal domain